MIVSTLLYCFYIVCKLEFNTNRTYTAQMNTAQSIICTATNLCIYIYNIKSDRTPT